MKRLFLYCKLMVIRFVIFLMGEERWEIRRFKQTTGDKPDLKNPKSLNEKMVWLKINYFEDFYLQCSDKYLVHDFLKKKLGYDCAPQLLFVTQNPYDLNYVNINQFPCIIKVSNGSGANLIINTKEQFSEKYLQDFFVGQIAKTHIHTAISLEHQYEMKKPYIVVEKLLKDANGGIPNDYKFLYINGNLEFIYCSVDRMGLNVRQIYDKDWNRLHFTWVAGADESLHSKYDSSKSIAPPMHLEEMKRLSNILAVDFPLVRIDFYDTNERVYIGEITLHHGSGHDIFYPKKYDLYYGEKLVLPSKNRKHR